MMRPFVFFLLCLLATDTLIADTVVGKGSSGWSYLHITNGVDPAIADTDFNTTWFNPTATGYNGPAFTTGAAAPLHYGGVDGLSGGTTLTTAASGSRYTTYFYRVFDGGSGFTDLKLSLLADDGAFVYLNGVLIARDGVTDPDTFTKLASSGNEFNYDNIALIGTPIIKPGSNILAISVHQTSTTSSDLGFDLEITGTPVLATTSSSGWAMLSPTSAGNGYDPATSDADFNTTWHSQSLGGYTGGVYDGPDFTTAHIGPFAYGGVTGIPTVGTAIPIPSEGTRGSAYFLKEIDGGVSGYNWLKLQVLADDGAYIYLNGNLVAIIGDLPAGASNDTWAQETNANGSETTIHEVILSGTQILNPGPNLLAVSLHNTATTSTDLGFTLALTPYTPVTPTIVRGPYLQSGAHNRMIVRWRTDLPGNSVVRYGNSPTNLTQTVSITESVTEHIVTLTGLNPDTKYFYQTETTGVGGTISVGATADHSFLTHPVPGTKKPARIWVIGDSGTITTAKHNVYNSYLTRTGTAHTDAWLMLGDNAYDNGTDAEFQAAVFDSYPALLRKTVIWSCIGNHEAYTNSGQPYLDLHTFPVSGESGGVASGTEHYYSFDHGNIHFISLDSNTAVNYNDVPGGGGMADWLELDLQATDKDWIIAFFHHGPYTKGSHNSDAESSHIAMRRYMTPLLEKYGVDLVLSGHSHCYERSMLINGHHSNMSTTDSTSGTFTAANIVDGGNGSTIGSVDASGIFQTSGGTGAYEKPLAQGETGTVYSICGASGKLSNWTGGSSATVNPSPHPVFIVNLRVMGSLILDIDGNTLHAQYIDEANTIRDDFTLVKGSTLQVAALDATFAESGSDSTATFDVTRSGATSLAENVNFQLTGTAIAGTDYTRSHSGTVSFAAGETSKSVVLTRSADSLAEGTEPITLELSPAITTVSGGTGLRDRYFIGTSASAPANLLDAPSQAWWFNAFGAGSISAADWEIDDDGDTLTRLEELAYGGTEGTDDLSRQPWLETTTGVISLRYFKNTAISDLNYQVRSSPNLSNWSNTDVTDSSVGAPDANGIEPRKGSTPMDVDRKFLQLLLELAP